MKIEGELIPKTYGNSRFYNKVDVYEVKRRGAAAFRARAAGGEPGAAARGQQRALQSLGSGGRGCRRLREGSAAPAAGSARPNPRSPCPNPCIPRLNPHNPARTLPNPHNPFPSPPEHAQPPPDPAQPPRTGSAFQVIKWSALGAACSNCK